MKSVLLRSCIAALFIGLAGCELVNEGTQPRGSGPGKDLVINEVFTIAPEKYYAYSWMEIMNPTTHNISLASQSSPASMYAVGEAGTLILSDNDGETWQPIPGAGAGEFNAISSVFPDTAIIVGDNGLV